MPNHVTKLERLHDRALLARYPPPTNFEPALRTKILWDFGIRHQHPPHRPTEKTIRRYEPRQFSSPLTASIKRLRSLDPRAITTALRQTRH